MAAEKHPMLWRLRKLVDERGWTLARLARRSGLVPSNLVRWARNWPGGRPVTIAAVARGLGMTVVNLEAGLRDERPGIHDAVLVAVRMPDAKEAIEELSKLDIGWAELWSLAKNWRAAPAVRNWARLRMQDAVYKTEE